MKMLATVIFLKILIAPQAFAEKCENKDKWTVYKRSDGRVGEMKFSTIFYNVCALILTTFSYPHAYCNEEYAWYLDIRTVDSIQKKTISHHLVAETIRNFF